MTTNKTPPAYFQNWIPYQIKSDGEEQRCRWLFCGDLLFDDPFFDETLLGCRNLPQNSENSPVFSSLEQLAGASRFIETTPPTAFIFHVSRCGSTLLSQLLTLDERNIVLAEPPLLDEILRHPDSLPAGTFQAALHFLGQKRSGREQHLFVKLDSWHLFFYDQIRAMYPGVPFFLLYRDPLEVLHSHQKMRGMLGVPGLIEPRFLGLDPNEILILPDEYLSVALERCYEAMLRIIMRDPLAGLANYAEGAGALLDRLAELTGLQFSPEYRQQAAIRAGFDAKKPEQVFAADKTTTPAPVFLNPAEQAYRRLEERRVLRVRTVQSKRRS